MARGSNELTKLLQRTSAMLLVLTAVCGRVRSASNRGGKFLVGGDISALTKIEQAGGVFRNEGRPGDAIEIMSKYGCNCFRLRLFVNPTYKNVVVNDLSYTIALAKRIKAAGAKLLLNFHYSDTWADPGHQSKPKAWEDLGFKSLEKKVHEYTRDCILEFKKAGALPDMVQPGNEIAPGMLWPDGKLYGVGEPEKQWDKFARLLKSAVQGVRDASGSDNVRIVLHIHSGGDWSKTKYFFEHIEKREVPYDIIGLSYYPWWHGSMEDLRENLRNVTATFSKDVFVVETAYPHRPVRLSKGEKDRNMRWPMTPMGQEAFLGELVRTVLETPKDRGLGVLWWYPESIPVKSLRIWYGGANAMFDSDGNVLPVLSAFQESAQKTKVDFSRLTSPIIFRGDHKYGFRDPAVVYHEGNFYLYFTLSETAADGGYYNMTAYSISSDLVHWTYPEIITPRDRNLNYSSPGNIIRYGDKWIICLQTYPTPNLETFGTKDSRIWIMRSDDLKNWSEPELLRVKGNDVPREEMGRMIDPYLLKDAQEPGKRWCFYKQNGVSMSYSYDLKNWTYVGRASAGENVTVIRQGDEYVMFHSPSNGIGVKRSKDPKSWGQDTQLLTLGQKQWPWAQGRLTAATVIDLTREPSVGKYIMFFHGSSKQGLKSQRAHGAASLAIAWSDDLVNWTWPGDR
ncbi:MAG: glycosyl hydrolase 53 family protein [Planctomycetota bacterium]|jgi:arabinogalactan endo-1,4-beta-galactosidase